MGVQPASVYTAPRMLAVLCVVSVDVDAGMRIGPVWHGQPGAPSPLDPGRHAGQVAFAQSSRVDARVGWRRNAQAAVRGDSLDVKRAVLSSRSRAAVQYTSTKKSLSAVPAHTSHVIASHTTTTARATLGCAMGTSTRL